jgi:hypothetical protein
LSLKNLLARDILRTNPDAVAQLKKRGFDGLLQDGELVIYNTDVLKVKPRLKPKEAPHAVRQEAPKAKEAKAEEVARMGGIAAQPPVKPQPVVPPPKKPKVAVATKTPEPPVGLNKAEIADIRKKFNLDALDAPKRKAVIRSFAEARKSNIDALSVSDEVLTTRRQVSPIEHAAMADKMTDLYKQRDEATREISSLIEKGDAGGARIARNRAAVIDDQIDRITTASDWAGTETARALNLRKYGVDRESMQVGAVLQRATKAKGRKLTPKETRKIEVMTSDYSKIEREVIDLRKRNDELIAQQEKLVAERVARVEKRKAGIASKAAKARAKIRAERADIKKEIAALGYRVNDVSGITAEGAYLVGRLATNYIRGGAATLDEVVRKVLVDVPELTKRDVYKALNAKDPKVQKKARSETIKRISQLKRQARLMADLDLAEQGIFTPKRPGTKGYEPRAIRDLRKQLTELRKQAWSSGLEAKKLERGMNKLNELQDQLASHYGDLKKRIPVDKASIESVQAKLKEVRRALKVDEDLASLNKQLKTGDFIIKERPKSPRRSVELERKEVELARKRKEVRSAIQNMQPRTARQQIGEGLNTLRTLKATADMSATLRQALALSARRPVAATRAFGKAVKAFGSVKQAEQINLALKSHPNHYLREKAGLFLAEFEGPRLSTREEMFMSNWAQKIPGYGRLVKASDRHMVTHINLMRAAAFDDFIAKHPNATTAEMKAWADFVNVASGRGRMNVGTAGEALSVAFFAPRFALSRFQYPTMLWRHRKNPRVFKEIAKDQVALAGTFAATLSLAKLAGADVSLDPRSSDFGKIKVGNTRYDIGAGFLQPMRYFLRLGAGATDRVGWTDGKKKMAPIDDFLRMISYKASPSVQITDALIQGKFRFGGGETTPLNVAYRTLSPILAEAIVDAWKDQESPGKMVSIALGEGLGLGVNTYKKKGRSKPR